LETKELKNQKIINKLLLWFLLISLLPLAAITSLQYYIASNSQRKEVDNNLISIAESKAKRLENYVSERQKNAVNIAQIPTITDAIEQYQITFEKDGINSSAYRQVDEKYRPFINNYLEIFGYSNILLISQSGNTIFSVKRSRELGRNYYQKTYKNSELAKVFDRAKTLMQVEISKFGYDVTNDEPTAFIASPVFKKNLIIGVVVLQLNNQEFNKVVNDYTGLGETGETIVGSLVGDNVPLRGSKFPVPVASLTADRIVFISSTRHDKNAAFRRFINTNKQKIHPLDQAVHGIKGIGITSDYRGEETIATWRYLPSLNGGIVVKMDIAEAFAPLKNLRNIVIILGVITLLFVIFAAFFVAKSISKPVIELTQAVQEFAEGNLNKQASVITNDEIGQLAQSFNHMAAQLKESFEIIKQREQELASAKEQLEVLFTQLQQEANQLAAQVVQSEKMSNLGQLVAGVAHEINNPVNFIYGNITPAHEYIEDLITLIQLYQQYYPNPVSKIQDKVEATDLDFLIADLPKLLNSMKIGAERIKEIVLSLRNFSRLDEAEMKAVNIHEGIDSTLMILESRLKGASSRPTIEVIKEYGNLPLVECYAGQLNQVFMNILANAIDALEEAILRGELSGIKPQIHINSTLTERQQVMVRISDNGPGIPENLQQRLFDPFFTTKPLGKGTGLGLSISYNIITEKHQGTLQCISSPDKGTEFVICIPLLEHGK
jgi:two-component system, NtrC family, sensor kinase